MCEGKQYDLPTTIQTDTVCMCTRINCIPLKKAVNSKYLNTVL